MGSSFENLNFSANYSLNVLNILGKSFQDGKTGAGDSADTILRLDTTGSSVPFRSISKGMKRKWSSVEKSMGGLSVGSSLSLGRFVHSSSSSDSKGSSGTACTRVVSSAKETDEESSMALDLDFSLNLGTDKVASPKEPANKALKVRTVKPMVDLELSLSTGPSESDVTSIYQGFPSFQLPMEKPLTFVETLNTDDGETSCCWKPATPQPVMPSLLHPQISYLYHAVTEEVIPPANIPDLSSSILTVPKSSVTCTSGITQQQQAPFNRSSNSKICQVEGCGKGARGATGRCISHGGGRRCQKPGCHKGAEGRTVYCKAHGGGRRCQHLGCTKSAEGRTDHCIAHGGGRRCNREGCSRAARGKSGLCIRHGGGKRCQKENCTKSAEGLSGLCISHGGGRRCQMPECTKGAQGSTMYCKAHGGGKRCTAPGCTKGAEGSTPFCKGHGGGKRCGFQGSGICSKSVHGGTNFCVAHGGGKRCAVSECTKSARGRTDYCVRHGGGKRCKFEGCGKSAQGSTDFCKAHGGGKRCSWGHPGSGYGTQPCCPCNSFARGKMGLCALHSGLVQDKRVHGGISLGPNIQKPNPISKTEKMKEVVREDYMNEDLLIGQYTVSEAEKPSTSVLIPEGRVHGGSLEAHSVETGDCSLLTIAYIPMAVRPAVVFKRKSTNLHWFLPSFRCYSPRRIKPETKSTNKTKKARDMARIINSKPWSNDLESSLASLSSSLSKTTVLQTLGFLRDPSKALQFFNWAQELGYAHTEQSYYSMLEILGCNRHLNMARNFLFSIEKRSSGTVKLEARFFNSLMRNFSRAGLFQESIKLFTTMKSYGVSPSVVTFNSLLTILLKRGRTNMAKNVYDEMLGTYGVTPDIFTFNILIRGFCMNDMVGEGFRIFKDLSRFGCEPDVITYNTLVDGLCRAGKVSIAYNVVKGMGKKSVDLNPNVVTYTTLIRGYCAKREIDKALSVFEEMVNLGLKANNITYNTLIKGLCEAQQFEKIKEILEGTSGDGTFSPDTCTFNTLMHCHCDAGNLDEALRVFERMTDLKIRPDSATYSVLVRSLCQGRQYEKAEDLLDKLSEREILSSGDGCKPLVAAYNPIFKYLCENGKTKKAEKVFRQLMKRGTQDPPSYKTLIMGHCNEGTFESGYELLVLMLRKDFLPDLEIYESLINGLLLKNKPLLAFQTLEKMLRSFHLPKSSTFHSILEKLLEQGSAAESASLIQLMLDKNIRQNLSFSTGCIRLLFGAGMNDKAFQIVRLLYGNGYSVKMEELILFLCRCKKIIEASKMLLFSLESHQSVDMDVCNTVIVCLCEINKLSEAFGLYYELVEMGVHQQLSCQNQLKVSLEAGGKSEEAEFVSKRIEENHS